MTKFLRVFLIIMYYCDSLAQPSPQECWYFSKNSNEEVNEKQCFNMDNRINSALGDTQINHKVIPQLSFNIDGLSFIRSTNGFFYVNRHGIMRSTLTFDNGPDYFSEGLARTHIDGKIGYFDKSLKIKIQAHYDFGFPFTEGQAIVCNGCVERTEGEHTMRVGGLWGSINKKGKVVQELHPQTTLEQKN